MKIDGVPKGLRPKSRRRSSLPSERGGENVNGTDGALGDWIEVVVVKRASR